MKKVLKVAMAVALAGVSSASAYTLWNLQDGQAALAILESEATQGGAFFGYDDANNAGTSYSDLPEPSISEDVYGPWLKDRGGKISFTTGPGYAYPFVGVGFNWIDPEGIFDPTDEDSEGISLCYMSERSMDVVIKIVPPRNYDYNDYVFTLPSAATGTHKQIAWTEFAQGTWGTTIDWPEYIAQSAGIQFKFGAPAGTTNNFYLGGLGWYNDSDECTTQLSGSITIPPDTDDPVMPVSKLSGFSLTQQGRVLYFNGLGKKAAVEIITMQGSIVKKAVDVNTLDLSSLPAGIYMVRVNGSSLKYTQKVLLK